MNWTPLENRLTKLPLVLAGPILRRVEKNSVSVWVALKESIKIQLCVQELNGKDMFSSKLEEPCTIGPYLHIICLTAKTENEDEFLTSGSLYTYNIKSQNGEQLLDPGKVGQSLCYSSKEFSSHLPTFLLPKDRSSLQLAQGS